jgi:hypothetical protein
MTPECYFQRSEVMGTYKMSVNGFKLWTTSLGTPLSSIVAACETRLVVIYLYGSVIIHASMRDDILPAHRGARRSAAKGRLGRP